MKLSDIEPVRVYLASLVGPVATALIGLGIWDSNRVNLVCGVLLAILSVPVTIALRSKVTPVGKVEITGNIADDVTDNVVNQIREDMSSIPTYMQQSLDNAINSVIPTAVAQTTAAITQLVQQEPMKPPVKVSNPPVEVNPYA